MTTMSITDIKAHAMLVLGGANTKESVIITKRGKALAKGIPFSEKAQTSGKPSEALVFEKDVVSTVEEEIWDANR